MISSFHPNGKLIEVESITKSVIAPLKINTKPNKRQESQNHGRRTVTEGLNYGKHDDSDDYSAGSEPAYVGISAPAGCSRYTTEPITKRTI